MRTAALIFALLVIPVTAARGQDAAASAAARASAGAPASPDAAGQDAASNVNARYTIERVDVSGISDDRLSQPLRDDLQALVGTRLDPDAAERLDERLAAELPGYRVRRRMSRGSQPGQIRLVFEVSEPGDERWIPFPRSRSKFVYHSSLGWSGALDIPIGTRFHRVTVGLAFGNDDDLIEEYSGYGFRIESRKVATERLGVSLEVARSHQNWRAETLSALDANPAIPEAYRTRLLVEPLVTFAIVPRLRVTGGLSVSELESLARSPDSQMANAAVFGVAFDERWLPPSGSDHTFAANYTVRFARDGLGSDLEYTRHFAQTRYEVEQGRNTIVAAFSAGGFSGTAPLFERFSLGDSSTLRGWNRFDVAPAGGDRMFHSSIEYRYRGFAIFLDAGSVWERGAERAIRTSTGFGYHHENVFLTLGFPLNADEVNATFMMGVRF